MTCFWSMGGTVIVVFHFRKTLYGITVKSITDKKFLNTLTLCLTVIVLF